MAFFKEKTVTISQEHYNDLWKKSLLLQCLKDFGVDNWEGYEDAYAAYEDDVENTFGDLE